ncbi:MAG: pyrroline-5-carboxylate reductase [Burkholderiaceae bacterium]
MSDTAAANDLPPIAFIGGGNMAAAIIGGLIADGLASADIHVVEPAADARQRLLTQHGVTAQAAPGAFLERAEIVVWAVKPQVFAEAATASAPHTAHALHLSIAAGIRTSSIAQWLSSERVVRAMPNTPALVGLGMTGLFARNGAGDADRALAEQVIAGTGQHVWVDEEAQLDAVTALSGSGPAYVFYFLEAMVAAGQQMGLSQEQAHMLAVGTFVGASELARASTESPEQLRSRVTSKGGTTHAAITRLEAAGVKGQFIAAMQAARHRARELGDEFGAG